LRFLTKIAEIAKGIKLDIYVKSQSLEIVFGKLKLKKWLFRKEHLKC